MFFNNGGAIVGTKGKRMADNEPTNIKENKRKIEQNTQRKAKKEKKWWRYCGADSISAATCIGIYAGKSGREFNSIFCFWGRQKNIPGILHRSGFTCLGLVEQNYEFASELL